MPIVNDEIARVFKSRDFIAMSKRYGRENHEDLRSEVMVMLLETPKVKLDNIISNGYLLPYAINIMRNQASGANKSTKFSKSYQDERMMYTEITITGIPVYQQDASEDYDDEIWRHIRERIVLVKIKDDAEKQTNAWFYHSRLFLLQMEHKNKKNLSKKIGIPYNSILYAINEYKNHLKEWLEFAHL